MKTAVFARAALAAALSGTALGGAATLAGFATPVTPSATAAKDPCTASEIARTVGKVVYNTGDYLDGHPEANQVLTGVLQQPPGPQSIGKVNAYFDANPKVRTELQTVTAPLTEATTQCKLSVSVPQMLSLLQAVQAQSGLPGGAGAPQLPKGALGGTTPPLPELR